MDEMQSWYEWCIWYHTRGTRAVMESVIGLAYPSGHNAIGGRIPGWVLSPFYLKE